jgi:dTDP-4-amino-4,6-dideoxygalactose transaminase
MKAVDRQRTGISYYCCEQSQRQRAAKEVLALPIYLELTNEMQDYIVEMILEFLN